MQSDTETMNDLRSQVYVDPADALRPTRRRVTVLRLMGYVAASAVAFAFLPFSYATALTMGVGFTQFAPIASGGFGSRRAPRSAGSRA